MKDERINILLVEDDKFDSFVTQHYLKKGHVAHRLTVLKTGTEALNFLSQRGSYKNARLPDLIILDMGLPDMSGQDVLVKLKKSARLARIPTIVLTGQILNENPVKTFNLYEHAYMNKWVQMEEFTSFINAVADFQRSVNEKDNKYKQYKPLKLSAS